MKPGFTLIEILVVISIMVVIASMMYPVLSAAQRMSERMASESLLKKVDSALRLYKTDYGAYPYQQDYADLAAGDAFANRLAYRVGSDISAADQARVLADAAAAEAKFDFDLSAKTPMSSLGYTLSDMADVSQGKTLNNAAFVARVAMAQARLAVVVGNLDRVGPLISDRDGSVVSDKRSIKVNAASGERLSAANPGMAHDYLEGEVEGRFIDGDDIVDTWGQPIVYICRALPKFQLGTAKIASSLTTPNWQPERFGFGAIGFNGDEGPADDLVSRPLLLYNGRVRLSLIDAGDGAPTPPSDPYFPDPGNLMHSDLRYYAAPGFEAEFELWSAGPDEDFDYMRDHAANDDNIAAGPYLEGIE